jgi:hypothetical protein
MATPTEPDAPPTKEFVNRDLRGARFISSDLSGVVMRGVDIAGADIDAPWLMEEGSTFFVNGVDVVPFVEAELNRRFPGRDQKLADDPAGLQAAWDVLQRTWVGTLERVAAMPAGTVDVSVAGEWSFSQTLRHLVHATDVWLGRAIWGLEEPFHPIGRANGDGDDPGSVLNTSMLRKDVPPYDEVLAVRAGRVAMVRDFIADVTPEQLAEPRKNPHAPQHDETVLHCLQVILEEEWEHYRFAVRDLDLIEAGADA